MPTLEFKGKQHIYAHHLTVPYRPLVPDNSKSVNPALDDDNLIIHGDNLAALKALLPRYARRVKCIYIDPPYNTGNEGWIYSDTVDSPLMREWLEQNSPVDSEDMERHDKWLCMMWPRLHLLRELLADDGAIFISIDDNEHHHLRMLMDEIFGADKFIASVVWQKRGGPPNDRKLGSVHEFVLVYGEESSFNLRKLDNAQDAYANPDNDPRGPWRLQQIHGNTRGGRWVDSLYYPIVNPDTGEEHFPPTNRNWIHNRERVAELIGSGEVIFGRDGLSMPQRKRYLSEAREGITWPSIWQTDNHTRFPTNRDASSTLTQLFGRPSEFDTPKPVGLIDRILRVCTGPDDIVLDSFAGSGTTAHAVLALNSEDGGNRKFILVESEGYADGITAERVRRVVNGVPDAASPSLREGVGGSFTYCTLGDAVDADRMLTGEALPQYPALASYLLHVAGGVSAGDTVLAPRNDDGLYYQDSETSYYLLYRPDNEFMSGNAAMLDETRAKRISEANRPQGRRAVIFGAGKYIGQRELTDMGITFCQLPYEMHRLGQTGSDNRLGQ